MARAVNNGLGFSRRTKPIGDRLTVFAFLAQEVFRSDDGGQDRFQDINLDKIALKSGVGLRNAIECIKQLEKQGDADVHDKRSSLQYQPRYKALP